MQAQRIFDADVHHQYTSLDALAPYMPDGDLTPYYAPGSGLHNPGGAYRLDAVPPGGGVPGSDPAFLAAEHLDRYGIEYAILNPASFLGVAGLPNADLVADLAHATNDWTIAEWLPVDDRFLGAIIVSLRDAGRAADEIRRVGAHPRMVQVTVTSTPCLLGHRSLHPVYEACEELGLPLNIHVGGAETGVSSGSYSVGAPSSILEFHFGMCVPAQQHLASVVVEGIFERFPNMTVIFNEFGTAWLPFVMWRLDTEHRSSHHTAPWLNRLPSEYIREFVRFTTQPLEEPENPKDLVTLLSLVGAQDLLLYSSDYPHWDAENPDSLALRAFPDDWRSKIFYDNARALYGAKLDVLEAAKHATAGTR
jgi:predicted TIM-barrel fold metal-dependent hydrolase